MKGTLVITTMLMAFMGAALGYTNSELLRYKTPNTAMELLSTQQDTNMLKNNSRTKEMIPIKHRKISVDNQYPSAQ